MTSTLSCSAAEAAGEPADAGGGAGAGGGGGGGAPPGEVSEESSDGTAGDARGAPRAPAGVRETPSTAAFRGGGRHLQPRRSARVIAHPRGAARVALSRAVPGRQLSGWMTSTLS